MFVLMFLLMAFYLTGQQLHEILGTITLVCFVIHHILNRKWYKNLLKGKYQLPRKMMTFINMILFIDILCLGMSGILMSDFVFDFIPSFGMISLARRIHMIAAYWGFVLMSIHLGFHWQRILIFIRKKLKVKNHNLEFAVFKILPVVICVMGIVFFIKNRIYIYMFAMDSFVFFDYETRLFNFILQYLLISGLCISIGYIVLKISRNSIYKNHKNSQKR